MDSTDDLPALIRRLLELREELERQRETLAKAIAVCQDIELQLAEPPEAAPTRKTAARSRAAGTAN